MTHTRRAVLGALGATALTAPARAAPRRKLLFVGNSFTLEHDLPDRVGQIAAAAGHEIKIRTHAENGAALHEHVARAAVFDQIAQFAPHMVVLQDFSTEPLSAEGRARSERAVLHILTATGACPVFFATWPRQAGHAIYRDAGAPSGPVAMNTIVHGHYAALQARFGGVLAPIGQAWIAAMARGIRPHRRDGYHANDTGAWLSALILADAMGFGGSETPSPVDPELVWLARGALDPDAGPCIRKGA